MMFIIHENDQSNVTDDVHYSRERDQSNVTDDVHYSRE